MYICTVNKQQHYKYTKNMQPTYNKSKIMRNAWYLMKRKLVSTFGAALRKAWWNEKRAVITAKIEGRTMTSAKPYNLPTGSAFAAGCLDCYANAQNGQYFGD